MKTLLKALWVVLVTVFFVCLVGCMPSPRPPQSTNELARDYAPIPSPLLPMPEEGSLWAERTSVSPYSDLKARMVGDIVTISVVESARASKNATTETERTSDLEANWTGVFDAFFGQFSVGGIPIPANNKIEFMNNFDGDATTTRTSSMTAFLTARVIHVLPNGYLVIRGSREVQVNNETQFIFVQGVVRPEDISSNNVVLSTYIADARIELTGYGAVSEKQRPGWGARLLDWIWPF